MVKKLEKREHRNEFDCELEDQRGILMAISVSIMVTSVAFPGMRRSLPQLPSKTNERTYNGQALYIKSLLASSGSLMLLSFPMLNSV